MADEYLAFEEQHRGTEAGFAALVKLNGLSASVGDAMPILPAGRRELYKRLAEHYLQHPDLDLAFRSLSAEPQSADAPELVMLAIERSPHASVKAGAIYQLACYYADQADKTAMVALMLDKAKLQQPRNEARLLELVKLAARLEQRGIDTAASRKGAGARSAAGNGICRRARAGASFQREWNVLAPARFERDGEQAKLRCARQGIDL